jgi:hypothetical protein
MVKENTGVQPASTNEKLRFGKLCNLHACSCLLGRGSTLVSEVGILLLRSTCNPDARPRQLTGVRRKVSKVVHGWLRGKTVHRSGAGLGGAVTSGEFLL